MNITKLFISLFLCLSIAYAGSLITIPSSMSWYGTLTKPFFTPPNYIFGPVWTFLYLLMALALAIVWSTKKKKTTTALKIFLLQLLLNFMWSFCFFGLHLPFLAFITIILLWLAIFKTIQVFLPISPLAAYMLIPYIIWVSFATILNLSIVILNK